MELCSETCDLDLGLQIDFYGGFSPMNSNLHTFFIYFRLSVIMRLHLFSFVRHHAELVLIHGLAAGVAEGADANLGLGRKKDRRRFSPRGTARSSSRAAAGRRSTTRWWSRHSLHLWYAKYAIIPRRIKMITPET